MQAIEMQVLPGDKQLAATPENKAAQNKSVIEKDQGKMAALNTNISPTGDC